MIDNYKDAEKFLNELRNKDEMLFRMAISHLMDVGIRNLTEENVTYTCAEIRKQDDSHSFMTNEYQCAIVETACVLPMSGNSQRTENFIAKGKYNGHLQVPLPYTIKEIFKGGKTMKKQHVYTFGTYAKTPHGNYEYVSQVGNYVTSEDNSRHVIMQIAEILHRAYGDIFIDAIDDVFMEKPVGFYGEKED